MADTGKSAALEDNLKRIVSECIRLQREAGLQSDANVIAYVACLQEVQKAWDELTSGASLSSGVYGPPLIAALSRELCNVLQQTDSPYVATAKMQVMIEVESRKQRIAIDAEQSERLEQAGMLERSIIGTQATRSKTVQAYEKLHKLVVEFVCVQNNLQRALVDAAAGEEVRAAVESVFPLSTVARFLTLGEEERLQQIEELTRITLGICLFNRHTGAGGEALPPDTQTYIPQAQRLQANLARHVSSLVSDLRVLQAAAVAPGAVGASEEDVAVAQERARAESVNVAQAFAMFQQLWADLNAGLDVVQQLEDEIQSLLLQVAEAVGGSVAVAKEAVYPLFDRLGTVQNELTEELRLLVVRDRLFEQATALLGGFASMLPAAGSGKAKVQSVWMAKLAVPSAAELAAQALEGASLQDASPPSLPEGHAYIDPPAVEGEDQVLQVLQGVSLCGLCPVALAQRGALVLAQLRLGLVQVDATGQVLGFSSAQALSEFAADPAGVMAQVEAAALQQPLLAKVLGLSSLHPLLNVQTVVGIMAGPLKVDFGCQTPTHFVERHIDYSYEWNEWALRRRALALANLRQKRTHSTQTALTHFKRDGETQVWLPKEAQVQTRVNKGQAMPKKLQYVAGLRGAPNTKMNVVRLELDLGQPHQH